MAAKKCSKCGEEKPATTEFFHKHSEGKLGLRPDCKVCFSARLKSYVKSRHAEILQQRKRFRAENKDRIAASNKKYYQENKERINTRQYEYHKRHWAETLERLRAWRKANPEKVQVWVRNRRAKLKGLLGSHTREDILSLMESQKGKCVYCRCNIRKSFQVDHIVPVSAGGANDKTNLQLLCKPCNLDKRAKDPLEYQRERGMLL